MGHCQTSPGATKYLSLYGPLTVGEAGTILATGSADNPPIAWVSFGPQPGGAWRMEWTSTAGLQYHVESSATLQPPWTALPGSPVTSTGSTASFLYTPPPPVDPSLFFRVRR